jgi:hypothetical protein
VLKDASFGKEVEGEVGAGPPRNTNGVNLRGPVGKNNTDHVINNTKEN